MKKKILIICGGFLAVTVVAVGTFNYYIKPKYVTPIILAVEEFLLEDEETLDLLIQEYEKSLTEDEKIVWESETTKEEVVEDGKKEEQIVGTSESIDRTKENNNSPSIEVQADEIKKPNKKKVVIGGKTMEELQEEVAPNDLKAGLKIASKIDTGHLLSLSKGGLTKEDKKQAKAHLQDRLTSSEYQQLKGFVGKYAYLLK